jgi:hypothetical protein
MGTAGFIYTYGMSSAHEFVYLSANKSITRPIIRLQKDTKQ